MAMHPNWICVSVVAMTFMTTGVAFAQDKTTASVGDVASWTSSPVPQQPSQSSLPDEPLEAVKPYTRSYASQTLLADSLSIGSFILGAGLCRAGSNAGLLVLAGAITYPFATPIIHASQGNSGRALGSLALRTVTLGVGSLMAFRVVESADAKLSADVIVIKVLVPSLLVLAAPAVLDALVANEEIAQSKAQRLPTISIAPTYNAKNSAVGLQVSGVL